MSVGAEAKLLTAGDVARELKRPPHQVRRVLDLLAGAGKIAVARVGWHVRLITPSDLPLVEAELARRWPVEAGRGKQTEAEQLPAGEVARAT
jgi:hypothetical protein